jgi:hypothetical protein
MKAENVTSSVWSSVRDSLENLTTDGEIVGSISDWASQFFGAIADAVKCSAALSLSNLSGAFALTASFLSAFNFISEATNLASFYLGKAKATTIKVLKSVADFFGSVTDTLSFLQLSKLVEFPALIAKALPIVSGVVYGISSSLSIAIGAQKIQKARNKIEEQSNTLSLLPIASEAQKMRKAQDAIEEQSITHTAEECQQKIGTLRLKIGKQSVALATDVVKLVAGVALLVLGVMALASVALSPWIAAGIGLGAATVVLVKHLVNTFYFDPKIAATTG